MHGTSIELKHLKLKIDSAATIGGHGTYMQEIF